MPKCSVTNCPNNSRYMLKKDNVSYFSFPRNPKRCSEWTAIIAKARNQIHYKPFKGSVVCSNHFPDSDIYTTTKGFSRLNKNAKPILHIAVSAKSQKKKKTQKPQYDPFQEYANDSTDEDSPEKPENSDEAENSETESENSAPDTEKVFLKSLAYKEKQTQHGQPESKRARLDTSEGKYDYTEELYEFGKFVAEQLMCLDVEDARLAQKEIKEVLSKFDMNKIMRCLAEPSTSNAQPLTVEHCTQTVSPDTSSRTKSRLKMNTARPSVPQTVFTHVKTSEPSVTQSGSLVHTARPSISQSGSRVYTAGPSVSKLGSQVNIAGPSGTQAHRSTFTEVSVVNVNPDASSIAPFRYVVVPSATNTGFNLTTQLGKGEGTLVTSAGSTVAVEPGSSSMIFSGASVKIEPEPDPESSDHVNVFLPSAETESFVIKYEPNSDGET